MSHQNYDDYKTYETLTLRMKKLEGRGVVVF